MSILEIFIIAIGLSMDAFAVAICKGLSLQQTDGKRAAIVGLYFGIFQGGMPLIGYFVGSRFSKWIMDFDHWIVFLLLLAVGAHMIHESRNEESCPTSSVGPKEMFPLAIATSIDALAVGISFAILDVEVFSAASLIAATTFVLSFIGVQMGCALGSKFQSKAELAGGIVLIAIGLKILLEHLNVL